MLYPHLFEVSKIQNKNGTAKFFYYFYSVFNYLGSTVDEVLTVGSQFAAEPAGAAAFEGFELLLRPILQGESVARM